MLTTSNFYRLNYLQQADLLLQQGLFLQTRNEGNFVIDLYELHDLLVEIFYQKENEEPVSVMVYNAAEKLKTLFAGNLQPRLTIRKDKDHFRTGNYAA
jgi:hypothetical protein